LGNCLGNDEQHHEDQLFVTVQQAFGQDRLLALLLGVSVMGPKPEPYPRETWNFFLQTPHHLLSNYGLLESDGRDELHFRAGDRGANERFKARCVEDFPRDAAANYRAAYGLRGAVYHFYYQLGHNLRLASDRRLVLKAGKRILLYSIIKYDVASLVRFLE